MDPKCTDSFVKLKHSRFRHVYSKSVRRSEWYDTGAGHGIAVAANPKMIALAIDVPSGGIVQVAKLCTMGKGHMEMGKIKDHKGVVCDVKWNPFNDNVIATGSQDATVRIWHVDDMLRIRCLRISRAHSRRVNVIEWHKLVDNVVLSASSDGRIVLWNIETDRVVYVVKDCDATSLSFSYNCSEFAVTTKSHQLIIFDARIGVKKRESELIHDGSMLPHVIFCGNSWQNEQIITTGNSRNTRRQIALYLSSCIDSPLVTIDLDGASGRLIPIIDNDLNLLYVAGKGEATIRFYEITNETPYVSYLNESSSSKGLTAVCSLPKRGLDFSQCEIMRLFRVDAEQLVIEPLSFIVPRRADCFQSDLFPPSRSPTPSLTFAEWFAGLDREPIFIELRDCVLNCTNKPVIFSKKVGSEVPKLLIADINNDRKFRFLAEVTKPDYRAVNDREDYGEILKIQEIREKIASEIESDTMVVQREAEVEKECLNDENSSDLIDVPSISVSDEVATLNAKNIPMFDISSGTSDIIDTTSLPLENGFKNGTSLEKCNSSAASVGADLYEAKPLKNGRMQKSSRYPLSPMSRSLVKRRGEMHHSCDENRSSESVASGDVLINIVRELEKELSKSRSRCDQLEKMVNLQQQDIDSLRFEINWKDTRIEYLQSQLSEMENLRSTSSRSS